MPSSGLLFRLSKTEGAEHYVLKGAMLFVTWPEHTFRPTGDLDLLGQGAYFSDRGRLKQADRGRRNDVAGEALG
jgi:hypothetical protein